MCIRDATVKLAMSNDIILSEDEIAAVAGIADTMKEMNENAKDAVNVQKLMVLTIFIPYMYIESNNLCYLTFVK